jgi:tetratricopeptide (TPR) repeat protein
MGKKKLEAKIEPSKLEPGWIKTGDNSWIATLQEDSETGDLVLPLPDELMKSQGFEIGDILKWKDNKDGSFSLRKKASEEKQWVLVEAVSTFRTRYMVEVPVGIDNYGLYFNELRSVEYPLKFGYFVTSNNAHNLPIQLLATGGFFVGALYMIMVLFIFAVATRKLRKVNSDQRVILTGLMISYSVFQLQSFVSIDNIGVSIWGWLIAGFIVGFNSSEIDPSEVNVKTKIRSALKPVSSVKTLMFSWVLVTVSLVLVALLYQGEKKTYDLEGYLGGTSGPVETQVLNFVNETLDSPLIEPSYKMGIADKLMIRGLSDQAMEVITELVNSEPRNLDYLTTRAYFAEYLSDFELAISDRENISRLNQYNAINYKFLVVSYLKTGKIGEAKKILDKVNSFAPNTQIAIEIKNSISNFEKGGVN